MKQHKIKNVHIIISIAAFFLIVFYGLMIIITSQHKQSGTSLNPFIQLGLVLQKNIAATLYYITGKNLDIYRTITNNPIWTGVIVISISFILNLSYLLPLFITNKNKRSLIGPIVSVIFAVILIILLSVTFILSSMNPTTSSTLALYKHKYKFSFVYLLSYIGPILLLVGAGLWFNPNLTANKSKQSISNKTKSTVIEKKETEVKIEKEPVTKVVETNPNHTPTEQLVSDMSDLKSKIAELKSRMVSSSLDDYDPASFIATTAAAGVAVNAISNEANKDINTEKQKAYWNSDNPQNNQYEDIRVGSEGQYLRTKDNEGHVLDESLEGLEIVKHGRFVEKNDVIKHRNTYMYKDNEQKPREKVKTRIILPKSKQEKDVDIDSLAQRIDELALRAENARIKTNPNAKLDDYYSNKVFLGDGEKIWQASIKYRSDITNKKNPAVNEDNNSISDEVNNIRTKINQPSSESIEQIVSSTLSFDELQDLTYHNDEQDFINPPDFDPDIENE